MGRRLSWQQLVKELIIFYLPWCFLGLFVGYLPWLLLLATWIQLIWYMYNQLKLSNWLWSNKDRSIPVGMGSWQPIFNGVYRLQRHHRGRRKELSSLVRRFRNGGESLPDAVIVFDGYQESLLLLLFLLM